jgi:hypothetical protein
VQSKEKRENWVKGDRGIERDRERDGRVVRREEWRTEVKKEIVG